MIVYDKNGRTRKEEIMPFKPIFNNSFEGPEETQRNSNENTQ